MKYIIIGLLLSIGWQTVELIFEVVRELLFSRLHKTDWYLIAAGKKPKEIKATSVAKTVNNRIGFHYTEKES